MSATAATRRPGHAGTLEESHLWVEDIVKTFPITAGMLR